MRTFISSGEIDRLLPVSMYYQLMQIIRDRIDVDEWSPHELMPTEKELCQTYNVSRQTVRQALDGLEKDGLIYRIQGKGTFVAEKKFDNLLLDYIDGFVEFSGDKSVPMQDIVLQKGVYNASKRVAHALNIPQDAEVIKIKLLRHVRREPYMLVSSYIPYALCPWLISEYVENKSVYDLFHAHNLVIDRAERILEPAISNAEHKEFLQMKEGLPIHKLQSVTYLNNGVPVEYLRADMRGDKSKYKVTVRR